MKLAIMQPYLFPYVGYFKLINSVDKFVFYDDVNYIKSGWINRNKLCLAGAVRYFTVPLSNASSFEKINQTLIKKNENWAAVISSSIRQSYAKAPFYGRVNEIIEDVLHSHDGTIGSLARNSVLRTVEYLGLDKNFVFSSRVYANQEKKGAERVIDICIKESCSEYWNLPGGRNLYSPIDFSEKSIELKFVDVSIIPYKQFGHEFSAGLSIIDVMMFNSPETIRNRLLA